MKKIRIDHQFSPEDISAIIAALPLVPAYGVDSPAQQQINSQLSVSAGEKLMARRNDISPNEFRVIAAAVSLAQDILAGRLSLSIDAGDKGLLAPHLFTYNRLASKFEVILDQFLHS